MKRNLYRLPVMILAVFFVGISLFLTVRPAEAIGSPWVKWKINLAFPGGQFGSLLTVQRGHTTPSGQHVIDDEVFYPLFCQSKGNPTVTSGEAVFDGSSYYQCAVPSIQDIAWQTWQMSIPDSCASKRPYVTGRVTIEGNPLDPTPDNPVFYREDIQFNVPLDKATQEAALDMTFDEASAESGAFTIDPAGHKVTAYIARSGPSTFSPYFVVDGTSLSATPATITQSRVLSNLASTIYFGYSPDSGEYFQGALGPVEVDPVCTTTG